MGASLRQHCRRPHRLDKQPLLLFPLALALLCSLSACGGAEIGNSDSTSIATVDNSVDDHSVTGDSQTSITCITHDDGSTEFTQTVDGTPVAVSEFAPGQNPCPDLSTDNGDADSEAVIDNSSDLDGEQIVTTGGIPTIPQ